MKDFLPKFTVLLITAIGLMAAPLKAQEAGEEEEKQAFIQRGTFLTGFSMGFINGSHSLNEDSEQEFSRLLLNLDGLYFVNDHLGFGPLLGYEFVHQEGQSSLPFLQDAYTKNWNFKFGAKAGWYTPASELFDTNARFFIDGGISWLRSRSERGGFAESDPNYQFGYQIGTGFLFPVGRQIAIETKLRFQSRLEESLIGGEREWLKEITLGVGFKVAL